MNTSPLSIPPASQRVPIPRLDMSDMQSAAFGSAPIVAHHNLDQSALFTDAALAELLDSYPRAKLHVLATGDDPTRAEDNRLALNDGVSGTDLLRAVRRGRLWLNITRVTDVDPHFRQLVDSLYEQLAARVAGFVATSSQATLLISSPGAVVYYHADGPASILWHIRGAKRVWVYPADDNRYIERTDLEDIFVGARHEYLPYRGEFDSAAAIYDLAPGQWIAWPQNAPHRVTNLDGLSVSLSTEHFTTRTRRRARLYAANRFFRTRLGCRNLSTRETGSMATLKTLVAVAATKAGLNPVPVKRHTATMRVDPDAPEGVRPLPE